MKYKEGDKVRIKSLDWYNENKDEYGYVRLGDYLFTPDLAKYCGEEFTISHTTQFTLPTYVMIGNGHEWSDEMIEGLVEEEKLSQNAKLVSERFSEDVNISEFKYAQDEIMKMLLQGAINIPDGYEFRDENGNVIEAKVITLEKKKPKYPQSYEECCKVLDIDDRELVFNGEYRASKLYWKQLGRLNILNKLLICRDAYWKIAGEEMGLGKPWEPDWSDYENIKYIIGGYDGEIGKDQNHHIHKILAFPTEEMRDAFYEAFKELVEECKELL